MQKQTQDIRKKVMQVIEITEEQIRKDGRDYNPSIWDSRIDSFAKYSDVKFYQEINSINSYTSYFAVYTTNGLRFMNSVAYSLSLSSNGFCKIDIDETTGNVCRTLFHCQKEGQELDWGYAENTESNRKTFRTLCEKYNTILSNIF